MAQSTPPTLTIKGIVIDSAAKQPAGYVTAALSDAKTQAPVKSTLTKDDGTFELKAAIGKPYTLSLVFIGYQNKVIQIAGNANVDLGKIYLQSSNKQLKEVTVTAAKPLMEQQVDRIAYNVSADPEAKSITALDMMRKVPLLTVDANDNIQLKGSGNYKILVNGKESGLLAKNPSDVLRSMPASNIVKIEVITTPPAKYDAEGLAGIINIITTKNADQGYNIGVNARYNTLWGAGLNLNATVKEGKFGFTGYAGLGKQNRTTNPFDNKSTYFNPPSVLDQSGLAYYNSNYKYYDGEFSYEIDSLNLITASVDFNNGTANNGENDFTNTIANNITTQQYNTNNTSVSKYTGFDASINYQLGFKKSKDQLLTLSYQYSYSPDNEYNQNLFTDTIKYPQPDFRQYNTSGERDQTIQVDYAQPFKKISLEAGGKAIFRNNFSNFHQDTLVNAQTNDYMLNDGQTNNFNYHQDVYSLYNSYQLHLENWTGKAGLRLEETTVNADFSSVGSTLNTNYTNLIPSVSLQRKIDKTSSITFGFTERIQRPYIGELNPFVDRSNPQFMSSGNPNLKPELNHVFELNYSYFAKMSVNTGFSYSFSNNSIQNVSSLKTQTVDGQTDAVNYSTYENLGSNRTLGYNINANLPITTKLSVNINGLINKVWLQGLYNGDSYKNSGYTGNMFVSIGYKFAAGYRIGVNTGYFSGNVTLQGKSSYFIYNGYVLSKDFLNKKASFSFVANNPWARYWSGSSTTRTNDFYQDNTHEQSYRNFAVRISYKFGRLNSDIKKNQHGIENDDTQSSNKGTGNQ